METSTESLLTRFKTLADPVRVRLVVLCGVAECSVSELTRVTGLSQPRISQHLKQCCAAGLLQKFRDGHFVYYRVSNGGADTAARRRLLALLPAEEPQFAKDIAALQKIRADYRVFCTYFLQRGDVFCKLRFLRWQQGEQPSARRDI